MYSDHVFADRSLLMASASLGVYTSLACVAAITLALFVSSKS
jgi:hypothetical protein